MAAAACRIAGPGRASRTSASKPAMTVLNVPLPLDILKTVPLVVEVLPFS
jgi:hypothetical protein